MSIKAWKDRVTFLCEGVGLPNHDLKGWGSRLMGLCTSSLETNEGSLLALFHLHKDTYTKYRAPVGSLLAAGLRGWEKQGLS